MRHPRPRWQSATAALAVAAALAVTAGRTAWGDDTVLFKTQVGKPYVYIVLDTSTSMNLAPATNAWLPASGDDPGSKFQQIKQALFQVFNEVYLANGDVVHFGFATFNQDDLRVRGKHWLYKVTSISNPLPIGYPIVGNVLTFGKHFSLGAGTTDGVAGGCGLAGQPAPLALSSPPSAAGSDVALLDRFSKLQPSDTNGDGLADAYATTSLWVSITTGANQGKYRIDVSQVPG